MEAIAVITIVILIVALAGAGSASQALPDRITGKAWVTDGDGLRVSGYEIRLDALDSPEQGEWAQRRNGNRFDQGQLVMSALIKKVGGKYVSVNVVGIDKFGRLLGIVTYRGEDVGEWLVRNGHATAAYGDLYKTTEEEANWTLRDIWGNAISYDPRGWRHRDGRKLL